VTTKDLQGILPADDVEQSQITLISIEGAAVYPKIQMGPGGGVPLKVLRQILRPKCQVRAICRGIRILSQIALYLVGNRISLDGTGKPTLVWVDLSSLSTIPVLRVCRQLI